MRQKGASDSKRAQQFGKLSRMISAQVKVAKGDRNAVLVRQAIEKARSADMPIDTIERAISKATEQKDLETRQLRRFVTYFQKMVSRSLESEVSCGLSKK